MNKIRLLLLYMFFVVIFNTSCGNQSVGNNQTNPDSSYTELAGGAQAAIDFSRGIDTLFIEGENYAAFFDNNSFPGNSNKNKAVFQFMLPMGGSKYLTMGLYPSIRHGYNFRTLTDSLPVLVLKNSMKGSVLPIGDTVILGDQQIGIVHVPPGPRLDNLQRIRDSIGATPNQKVVVFTPFISSKHLKFKIYVVDKAEFTSVGSQNKFIDFSTRQFVTMTDPSPPATSLD